ncbi:copper amine oxidase [Brachybacterium sacelli]|uniref:Amine oxidase n=1 Tax=Brachybacterium sacelli TaxID=173364 RepID=A0ABS4WZS8_9MICO|nr:copper amine oxidase [Brachybacterium sacelli]MBP2380994.1 primary-amine oxidase [Brachybacterium sacelli]
MNKSKIALAAVLVVTAGILVWVASIGPTAPGPDAPAETEAATGAVAELDCGEGQELSRTLTSGATWSMCWSIDPDMGLVVSDIHLTPPGAEPISLISSLALSQLEVPYDDGGRNTHDITESGFGGTKMKTLDEEVCTGDLLAADIPNIGDGSYGETETRQVLCSTEVDGGVSYHSSDAVAPAATRKQDLQLFTVSRVGWYEYITEYTFGADGSIDVQLGATGDLSPVDYTDEEHGWDVGDDEHAASHSHNAVWRVHWALGGDGGMQAEQFDAEPTGEMGEESALLTGDITPIRQPTTAQWQDRRWWRVLNPDVLNEDGHPISYQIDMKKTDSFVFADDLAEAQADGGGEGHEHESDLGYDVAFTNYDECERFAVKNRGDCGGGVQDFVEDGSEETLDDVVSWVAVGFHHVARDEDQSPMEMHWQGFSMLPRDLTAQRFDVPEGHEEVNGIPDSEWHESPTG